MKQFLPNKKHYQFLTPFFITLKLSLFLISSFFPSLTAQAAIEPQPLFKLINEERDKDHKDDLKYSENLEKSAQEKALDILENEYFDHDSPEGVSPWYWMEKNGYDFIFAGENLAIDFTSNKQTIQAWMNSETHKDNILNNKFKEIGIGIASGNYDGRPSTIIVAHFGSTPESFLNLNNGQDPATIENSKSNASSQLNKINTNLNISYLIIASIFFIIGTYTSYLFYLKKDKNTEPKAVLRPVGLGVVLVLLTFI